MKKITSIILSVVLILTNLLMVNMFIVPIGVSNATASFAGGDGSAGNPFQIANVTHLQNMSANLSAHYILITDIDCTVTSGWNGGLGFSPVGNDTDILTGGFQGLEFTGTFDGKGYKIINLTINRSLEDYVGLFGYINTSSVIINVTLINNDVNGDDIVGGLIGENYGGTVTNSYSNGSVTGNSDRVGGLIGWNYGGTVTNCTSTGSVNGNNYVGGLIGDNFDSTVTNCTSTGSVTGNNNYVGGLIGANTGTSTVTNCTSTGSVNGNNYVGGLIGQNSGTVNNCTVFGDTSGTGNRIGGLIGNNPAGAVVTYCNVYGNVTGTGANNVGGLIGRNDGTLVSNCHVVGNVDGPQYSGGLIGLNVGPVTDCTATGNTTGSDNNVGGLIGENWVSISNCSSKSNVSGNSYTGGLIGQNGGGTITNCHSQGSVAGMARVGGLIGNNNGQTVSDCSANVTTNGTNSYVGGLIGRNNNNGPITNCHAYGDVNGTAGYVGGLIGDNQQNSPITNCTANGNVEGDSQYVGGLIGANQGPVTNCTAFGFASGETQMIGGLIGGNFNEIKFSTAWGNATGIYATSDYVGGLIGYHSGGKVENCYAHGNASAQYGVGGLVGWLVSGTVQNCTSYGDADGSATSIGGSVGINEDTIINCTSLGAASGDDYIGGLIGENNGGSVLVCKAYGNTTGTGVSSGDIGGLIGLVSSGTITNCRAYGYIIGSDNDVGGLIGDNSGSVTGCVAYGTANSTDLNVGGLVGYNQGIIQDCIAWGDAISLVDYVGGLIGTNDATVTNCTAYGDATSTGGDGDYVGGLIGESWGPVTDCHAFGDAWAIDDFVGGLIGNNENALVDKCTAAGNASGNWWVGGLIGISNFGTITNSSSSGFVNGTGTAIGGFIGDCSGTIDNCTTSSNVKGDQYVGGFIGYNAGTVTVSYSSGMVDGSEEVGGFVGRNWGGIITNCYTTGIINGSNEIGGFSGTNFASGNISYCYSTGIVTGTTNTGGFSGGNTDDIYNSFWDNITSGQTSSYGGTGKNTSLMMQESTFTGAGWDFINIWAIIEGKTYPYFGHWYNPPQVIGTDNNTAYEGSLYSVDYDAIIPSYPPGNYVDTWTVVTNSSGWLSIDPNGLLSGTPTNDDLGIFWINITVTDILGGKGSHNFTLTVLNVNSPPMITTPNNTTAYEDTLYTVDYDATDPDPTGDSIYWNYTTNATWLNFNKISGILFGWPVNADVGSYWVNITADDGKGGETSTNFTLNVININGDPIISTLDVLTAHEDILYTVDYNATDEEGDTLTWSMTTNSTSYWLGIDTVTGVLSGIPDNNDVGEIWVNITVIDGNDGSAYTNFTLTILNTNDDPVITTTDVTTATEDVLYSVDYEVSDEDVDNVHEWTLSTNADWLDIDDSTGVLSGLPTNADVGNYWVNVQVDDYNLGTDSHNFSLAVINVNDAPSITTADVETTVEDELYSVQYNASDIDPTNDIFTWTLSTNAGWLSMGAGSGILSGTPDNGDVGEFWVNITVDDGNNGTDLQTFTLTVTNVNDDPVITTTDVTTATAGELYSVDYNATDVDPTSDVLTWSKTGAGWLSINPGTGILSGTPTNDHVGTYSVEVTVSDGNGGNDTTSFILTVEPGVVITNLDPEITTTDLTTITAGEIYTRTYDATDDRTLPANLTWSMSTNADWLTFDPATRVLSGTTQESDVGTYWVLITVEDGEGGSDSTDFNITVIPGIENNRPVLSNGKMTPASGDTDTTFTFSVHYYDADGDVPTEIKVVIDGVEHDMELDDGDAADGTYDYSTKLSKGTHSYYFTASDGMDSAISTDGTPTGVANAESTSAIEEVEEEAVTDDWTMYLILIIIIVIIIALLAFAMSRRGGKPLTEDSFFIDEEEEAAAEEMASEEEPDEDIDEEELGEDEEVGFECPTCGAVLAETDTKCLECGEEFEDE